MADISLSAAQVRCAQVTVAVPSITASGTANVGDGIVAATATVTGVAAGDIVIASPTAALPTNSVFVGAYVVAADTVTFEFSGRANLAVTGANRTFNVQAYEKS